MQEILLPKMGNTVEEAEIVKWLKKEGDPVEVGEPLFTIQTDKAEVECESTATGILRKILAPEGATLPVLTVVALVGSAEEPLPDLSKYGIAGNIPTAAEVPVIPSVTQPVGGAPKADAVLPDNEKASFSASPRARKTAVEHGVDLKGIQGSGVGGRIMEADVLASMAQHTYKITPTARRMAENAGISPAELQGTGIGGKITKEDVSRVMATGMPSPTVKETPPLPAAPQTEARLVPLTPMRRIIAERMCASKYSAPHYYITVEVDMQNAKAFRSRLKTFKASYNDLVMFATAKALREFPSVNARWLGDAIEEGGDVNLGMAVALPAGLIVPVIRKAHLLSLEGLCAAAKALAEKAQTGKLLPDDYQGNTFTVSNLGAYGVDHFTAIINQPDSAILAVGQMKDRVVVIDGGIHIRPIMKLTLSSDHRVIDGAVAAQFMGRLKAILEEAVF